ncbi:hypothetical protein [Herbaspirillum sp. RV1423]|uniref:hypothetical protein n=1 Tax=Herbaspirillum sp. RV1423 TaxID=1443993 RepID=UPI0004AD738A|nr:hypothetical protein [Herbaspirillum sp. RV1423]
MQALFLGAGASYDCGMPIVIELTSELRRWLTPEKLLRFNAGWRTMGIGWRDHTVLFLHELLKDKSRHYENIIGAIQSRYNGEVDQNVRNEWHSIYLFLCQAIQGLLVERQIKNSLFAQAALDDYEGIKVLLKKNRPLWIFSLNHDIMIEILSAKYSIPIKSGFKEKLTIEINSDTEKGHEVNFEKLSRIAISNNDYDFFRPGEDGINLIKLHGSLDIFGVGDELSFLKIAPHANDPNFYVNQLDHIEKINRDISLKSKVHTRNEHVHLDSQGEIQFLRDTILSGGEKFTRQSLQLAPKEFLPLFEDYLHQISELICIGYGFGDDHIDSVIAKWLAKDVTRTLDIVNPGIDACPNKYKHLSQQVKLTPKFTNEFFLDLDRTTDTLTRKWARNFRSKNRERMRRELLQE